MSEIALVHATFADTAEIERIGSRIPATVDSAVAAWIEESTR